MKWQYVFTPQNVIKERLTGNKFADLARACAPALQNLLSEGTAQPELPLFGPRPDNDAEDFSARTYSTAFPFEPRRQRRTRWNCSGSSRRRPKPQTLPVFSALLGSFDEACKAMITARLQPSMPATAVEQRDWFEPYMPSMDKRRRIT